jgi:riboflavin kinase / FMN adenylyltransferase
MVQIHTNLAALPPQARGCVIAIGAFDGLHLGHQALLAAARSQAPDCRVMLATFEPPPKQYFNPAAAPGRLTTPATRAIAAARLSVDHIVELAFDTTMANMDAAAFATMLCGPELAPAHLVVGYDFAFGKGRVGNPALLSEVAAQAGITVSVVPPVDDGTGVRISSTAIRQALMDGDVAGANRWLGRPWMIEGVVVDGEKRGRTLGWPTANMVLGQQLAPRFGIYVVAATLPDGRRFEGVANFGRTPTTGLRDPLLEVHLLDFTGDLYGQTLHVTFHAFLRGEARFESLPALVAQIDRDARDARTWFASHG